MKPWLILGVLLVALMTTGSSCINESFIIPVNIPLQKDYTTNPGGSWNASEVFVIYDEIPASLNDDIVGSRLVDIQVQALNPPATAVVSGTASVNGTPAVSFSGTGAQFASPVSVLNPGVPALITQNQAGIDRLIQVLDAFLLNPESTTVTLSSSGTVTPAVASQTIRIIITVQADAQGSSN